jgi:hypothetical protein
VLTQVGRRDDGRADRSRGEVDGPDTGLGVFRGGVAVYVGAGGLEQQIGLLVETQEPVDAFMAGLQAELAGAGQALGLGVDAHHPARLQPLRAQQLVQQVGADIARADDGDTCFRHNAPIRNSVVLNLTR